MGEAATTETGGTAGETSGGAEAQPLTIESVQKLVTDAVTAAMGGYTTKIKGELASLRRGRSKDSETGAAQNGGANGNGHAAPPPAVTQDDLRAMRELGRLEASLPAETLEALREDLEGLTLPQQASMLRAVARVQPRDADKGRGEMPASTPRSARAAASAQREAAPRPTTLMEYVELAKTDPKRKAALDADVTFDPSDLPRTAPRR